MTPHRLYQIGGLFFIACGIFIIACGAVSLWTSFHLLRHLHAKQCIEARGGFVCTHDGQKEYWKL